MAQSAMRNLNNHDFNGRPLRVGVAAGEQAKEESRAMQQMFGGPSAESPYGEPVEPEKAPEAISRAVASLPPEQMFELMKQMKLCIQNNPNEARNMLLQNPQLAYALLQAQIVMKIVDPQVALAMLHRPTEQIPPLLPSIGGANANTSSAAPAMQPSQLGPVASMAGLGNSDRPVGFGQPSRMAGPGGNNVVGPGFGPGPMLGPGPAGGGMVGPDFGPRGPVGPHPRSGLLGDMLIHDRRDGPPGMQMGPRGIIGEPRGPVRPEMPLGERMVGMVRPEMNMRPRQEMGMRPEMGPRPDMGMGPRPDMGMGLRPDMGMGPRPDMSMGPRPDMGMGPRREMGPEMGMGPRRDMGPGMGPGLRPRMDMGPGMRMDMDMGPHDMRDSRQDMDMRPRPSGPPGGPSPVPNAASASGISAQDQEKAALIMQVLQLSDEQIAMLPPDQRQSILILKEQIARSTKMT